VWKIRVAEVSSFYYEFPKKAHEKCNAFPSFALDNAAFFTQKSQKRPSSRKDRRPKGLFLRNLRGIID